jgi:hypothetical protein
MASQFENGIHILFFYTYTTRQTVYFVQKSTLLWENSSEVAIHQEDAREMPTPNSSCKRQHNITRPKDRFEPLNAIR